MEHFHQCTSWEYLDIHRTLPISASVEPQMIQRLSCISLGQDQSENIYIYKAILKFALNSGNDC